MHVAVSPTGMIQPCCRFLVSEHNEAFANVSSATLLEGQQSPGFQAARESFARGEFPKGCASCAFEEKNGIVSMREKAVRDYTQTTKLEFIELFLGNTCNMKCRTCNPLHSSKWEKDADLISWELKSRTQTDVVGILKSIDLHKIRRLKLLGGEPFYAKSFYDLLDHLEAEASPERIALEINSNASVFPTERVLAQLRRYRRVELGLSIDDIGRRAERLRTGTVWSVVDEHLQHWQRQISQLSNFEINVHMTISAYNVLHIDSVILHLLDRGFTRFSAMSVKLPSELSPLRVSLAARQLAWQRLELAVRDRIDPLFLKRLQHILLVSEELDPQAFVEYSQKLDSVRTEDSPSYRAKTPLEHPLMG